MIEIPVVAEGGLTKKVVNDLENITDFLAFGDELWNKKHPLNELNHLLGLGHCTIRLSGGQGGSAWGLHWQGPLLFSMMGCTPRRDL